MDSLWMYRVQDQAYLVFVYILKQTKYFQAIDKYFTLFVYLSFIPLIIPKNCFVISWPCLTCILIWVYFIHFWLLNYSK